jgi:arylsulfatase A-like enzyme/Tfp pilus assembly protein PilF
VIRGWRLGGLLLLLGTLAAASGAGLVTWFATRTRPRNLILVSIDTLRADRLGCYGHAAAQTPRLDRLAGSGLRFAQATTVLPLTLPAHSSLMTGTFPTWHGVRDNGGFYLDDEQTTLAEVLREQGYRTGGFVGAFVLDRRWGIAQGFDHFFDEFDLEQFDQAPSMDFIQRPGAEVVSRALDWIGQDQDRPFFAFVHLYDPHTPYLAPEPFRSRFPATRSGAYDAEVASTDAQVGRLLDALAAAGRLDDTLVIVVGDHGEMLGEHGEQQHGFFIYDAAVRIPLIIAGPGVTARDVAEQVRIVDVMPTALDLLDVATPTSVQGVSLLPLARGESLGLVAFSESWFPRYHYGWSDLQSVQDGRYKYIRAPRPELYDLQADPAEAHELSAARPQLAANMDRALAAFVARTARADAPRGPTTVDADTEARLMALGYIASASSGRHLEERPRGDPKDKIALFNLLKEATSASFEGRVDEAIAMAKRALKDDPEIVEGYVLLGNFYKKAKQPAAAIETYRQALERDPTHDNALFSLAVAYLDEGRLDEARLGFERARELDPRNGKVLFNLADVWMRQGRTDLAEAVIRDALARQVDEHRFLLKLGENYISAERYDEAERALLQALERKPGLDTARFNLGLVYEHRGEVEKAIASYGQEVERNSRAFRAAFNMAKLLQQTGRLAEAIETYRKVAEMAPDFGIGQLYLAKALLDAGNLADAEHWARKGLGATADPQYAPLGHYVLADLYNRQGRFKEAERELNAAKRLRGDG